MFHRQLDRDTPSRFKLLPSSPPHNKTSEQPETRWGERPREPHFVLRWQSAAATPLSNSHRWMASPNNRSTKERDTVSPSPQGRGQGEGKSALESKRGNTFSMR